MITTRWPVPSLPALVVLLILCSSSATGADRHGIFSTLLSRYVDDDGMVDYAGFAKDPQFPEYLKSLNETNPDTLRTSDERLAFWINAYNAYTIKLIIDRMPLSSIRDIGLGLPVLFGPWSIEVAAVGGETLTLNAIEHDIIREQFHDARLHFTLVCAARSCPKLRREAYEGSRLHSQLEEEARRFINDPERNRFETESGTAFVSMIFDWYEGDFDDWEEGVLPFIAKYVSSEEARAMLLSGKCEIEYLSYDWSLNSK